jgi:hypothetical protein
VTEAARGARAEGFSHGRLCLDFAAHVGARSGDPAGAKKGLRLWLFEAGLTERPSSLGPYQLQQAVALGKAMQACAGARVEGSGLPRAELRPINTWAALPVSPRLDATGGVHWQVPRPVEGALGRIARDAVELLSGDLASRIRRCPGSGCGRLFLDRSSAGNARWCSMATCGNRIKVATYRQRRRAASTSHLQRGALDG